MEEFLYVLHHVYGESDKINYVQVTERSTGNPFTSLKAFAKAIVGNFEGVGLLVRYPDETKYVEYNDLREFADTCDDVGLTNSIRLTYGMKFECNVDCTKPVKDKPDSLHGKRMTPELMRLFPISLMRELVIVPIDISEIDNTVAIAVTDSWIYGNEDLVKPLCGGRHIIPVMHSANDINSMIDRHYGSQELSELNVKTEPEVEAVQDKPKIVHIIGSTKFADEYRLAHRLLTAQGYIVIRSGILSQSDNTVLSSEAHDNLVNLCKASTDICDIVYVVNKDNYIGDSTRDEICYAYSISKPVEYMYGDSIDYEHIPINIRLVESFLNYTDDLTPLEAAKIVQDERLDRSPLYTDSKYSYYLISVRPIGSPLKSICNAFIGRDSTLQDLYNALEFIRDNGFDEFVVCVMDTGDIISIDKCCDIGETLNRLSSQESPSGHKIIKVIDKYYRTNHLSFKEF